LVGGQFDVEVVVLSVPDLFVMPRDPFKLLLPIAGFKNQAATEGPNGTAQFKLTRSTLAANNFRTAFERLKKMPARPSAAFEYLADIVLLFGQEPLTSRKVLSNYCALTDVESGHLSGRRALYVAAKQRVYQWYGEKNVCTSRVAEQYSLRSELDTDTGIFTGTFTPKNSTVNSASDRSPPLATHTRRWFASDVANVSVLVGELVCKGGDAGCLNVGVDISRENSEDFSVAVEQTMLSQNEVEIGYSLSPRLKVLLGPVYMCMIVRCNGSQAALRSIGRGRGTVACEGGDKATILISTQKTNTIAAAERTQALAQEGPSSKTKFVTISEKQKRRCWGAVRAANGMPTAERSRQHIANFKTRATRTELGLRDSALSGLSAMFRMSRYLMLSAGSKSVVNLQGIWADGRKAEWDGDYHLNINLQMHYW